MVGDALMSSERTIMPDGYQALLGDLKERIAAAQIRAAVTVNQELVGLYWQIGRAIRERQSAYGWGAQVIEHLAADLRHAFPEMKGFSARNLRYMRDFADRYPDAAILQQVVAKLPWGHIVRLLDRVADSTARDWYAHAAIEHGWSRAILLHQIDTDLYSRHGQAQTNFSRTLPVPQSELAAQVLEESLQLRLPLVGCRSARARPRARAARPHP